MGRIWTATLFTTCLCGDKPLHKRLKRKTVATLFLLVIPFMVFALASVSTLKSFFEASSAVEIARRSGQEFGTSSESEKQRAYIDSLRGIGSRNVFIVPRMVSVVTKHRYDLDKNDIFSYEGSNVGNFVWEHAAIDLLPDFSTSTVCEDGRERCMKNRSTKAHPKRAVLYWPTANIFEETNGRSFNYLINIARSGDGLLIVGAGIQANFGEVDKDIEDPDEQRRIAVENFNHSEGSELLFSVMENYSQPIMMRGDMTLQTAQRIGYTHGISAGCPSLFLNKDIYLGQTLESKYMNLKNRIGDKTLKVGINIGSPRGMDFPIRIYEQYPNSVLFSQGPNDIRYLSKRGNIDKSRVKMFSDVKEWIDAIREMDVVIGSRIHGNMVGLGASVPVFVIAPDYRVLELVQRMKVPHTSIHDEIMNSDFDVAEVMYNNRINGNEFDRNRCEIAKIYRSVFGRYGFGVSSHVRQISEIC